ncbi:hypothetical protein PoB_001752000 [Plakobranchus ocellatus]|uniref:Uncharacterized protein n=1 Tax=Plakobranchus ocellatus TaxID=259542 RepID=A0AAV3Z8X3_9GAST|nr:hypothetical protein PoB_001752000 [Plakobranchus ocellatus]
MVSHQQKGEDTNLPNKYETKDFVSDEALMGGGHVSAASLAVMEDNKESSYDECSCEPEHEETGRRQHDLEEEYDDDDDDEEVEEKEEEAVAAAVEVEEE